MTGRSRTPGITSRYVWRAFSYLKPYWPFIAGAYFVVFISNGLNVWMPAVIRRIVDSGIRVGVVTEIVRGGILLMGLAVGRGLCTFLSGRWTETASQSVAFDIRNEFHEKLQSLSFSFHDESETGQLLARSVADVDRIRFLTGRAFLHIIQMGTLIVAIAAAMLIMNARLALPTLVVVPILAVSAAFFGSRFRPISMRIRDSEANLTSRLEQNLRGARIVKAFGREQPEIDAFSRLNDRLLDVQRKEASLRSTYLPLMRLIAGVGTLIVLVYGGILVIRSYLTIGELVAFSAYLTQLLVPVRRFGWVITAVSQASASAERIFEILDIKSEIEDSPNATEITDVRGAIRFEHVTFAYTRSDKVLDAIDFQIDPGQRIALLGGTGSGKTSIINLIPRFYDPVDGTVYLDERDIQSVTVKSLRDHIGIVLQDTVLFASSIRENIAFARPGADDEEVIAAAKAARAHEFITQMQNGYDTYVGEMGVTLSGGQKQRISIARAILKDPEILILDDATSSVDTETERLIQEALDVLMEGRTSIIIAQRLSTIRSADLVLVLDRGKIAARGMRSAEETPHEQLLRTSSVYADIFERQLRPEARDGEKGGGESVDGGPREPAYRRKGGSS